MVADVVEALFLEPAGHALRVIGASPSGGQKGAGGRPCIVHGGAVHRPGHVHLDELDPAAGLDEPTQVADNLACHALLGASGYCEALVYQVTGALQLGGPRLGDVMDAEGGVGWRRWGEEAFHNVVAQKRIGFR